MTLQEQIEKYTKAGGIVEVNMHTVGELLTIIRKQSEMLKVAKEALEAAVEFSDWFMENSRQADYAQSELKEKLVEALEDLLTLKSQMQLAEKALRRAYREELSAEMFANMQSWLTKPISYLKEALAEHKAKPVLSDDRLFQNGRQFGFREGFAAGRKSAGLEDIEVRFESFHEKATLSEDKLLELISEYLIIEHIEDYGVLGVAGFIVKALHDAGVLNVKED